MNCPSCAGDQYWREDGEIVTCGLCDGTGTVGDEPEQEQEDVNE